MKRKIAIVSMSFSGSTLLSGIFNYLRPTVISMGEIHWLVDRPGIANCNACGESCEILERLDRQGLTDANVYDRLLEAANADVLVSSDKGPSILRRFVRPGEADLIFLFKSPMSMAFSNHNHRNIFGDRLDPDYWIHWHNAAMRWCLAHGRTVTILEYEKFAKEPSEQFARLCKRLDLPEPPKEISFPPPDWHNIAGNEGTWLNPRYETKPIVLDERWMTRLPANEVTELIAHSGCMSVWHSLQQQAI
jgi:hypothetical protein